MHWKNIHSIDHEISEYWRARKGTGQIIIGNEKVDEMVSKWQVINPLLVSEPGSNLFHPVLGSSHFKIKAFNSAKRLQLFSILYSVFFLLLLFILYLISPNEKIFTLIVVMPILLLYLIIEHRLVVSHIDRLFERASFVIWVYKEGKIDFIIWITVLFLLIASQYVIHFLTGGFEEAIYKAGLIFNNVNNGEWWRLITGPYFHNGLPHWIINMAMLLIIGPIIGTISRIRGLQVFIIGNIICAISALLYANFGFSVYDSYMGVSGGILAMMGWLSGFSLTHKKSVPNMFFISIFTFSLLNIVLAWLMIPNSSNVSHITGFIFGFIWAIIPFKLKPLITNNR